MGYKKERVKLEKLAEKVTALDLFNQQNLKVMDDAHEQYSHMVRILKNKKPDEFTSLYQVELQDVKAGKKAVKESETDEARQEGFNLYKTAMLTALEKTIKATIDFL
jgi:phage terminase small subunit